MVDQVRGAVANIRSNYHRFLAHLAQRHVHDDVRRRTWCSITCSHWPRSVHALHARGAHALSAAGHRASGADACRLTRTRAARNGNRRSGDCTSSKVRPFRGFMRQEIRPQP